MYIIYHDITVAVSSKLFINSAIPSVRKTLGRKIVVKVFMASFKGNDF